MTILFSFDKDIHLESSGVRDKDGKSGAGWHELLVSNQRPLAPIFTSVDYDRDNNEVNRDGAFTLRLRKSSARRSSEGCATSPCLNWDPMPGEGRMMGLMSAGEAENFTVCVILYTSGPLPSQEEPRCY